MGILDFLGFKEPDSEDSGDVESIRKISAELAAMPRERARFLAAFAYLLGRVAHADRKISGEESEEMERILIEHGHLSRDQAVMTAEIAKSQNRLFGHVDNFLVAKEFAEITEKEQRKDLLDCLFAVCAADDSISSTEDREIRQIASELLIEHHEFIEIRSRYRDYLEVLKRPEE